MHGVHYHTSSTTGFVFIELSLVCEWFDYGCDLEG